jgi:hypothetical protein
MFLLYHSEGCNSCVGLFRKCYVNDLHTTTYSGMLGHRKSVRMDQLGDNTAGEASIVDKAMDLFEGWCTEKRANVAATADGKWRPKLRQCRLASG